MKKKYEIGYKKVPKFNNNIGIPIQLIQEAKNLKDSFSNEDFIFQSGIHHLH
jgi:hypothetical protein